MTKAELATFLRGIANEIQQDDQSDKIRELESALWYFKNEKQQLEIKVMTLENRLKAIKNFVDGWNDTELAQMTIDRGNERQ